MLALVGAGFLTIGVVIYTAFLKEVETRTMMTIALSTMAVIHLLTVALTLQVYEKMGINVFVFIFFTSSTLYPLIIGLVMIPPFVVIAKISPSHVEATVYAFSASVINSVAYLIPKMTGIFWNKVWFHISKDNLDDLYKAYIFSACCALISIAYTRILPTWDEVREVQDHLKDFNLKARMPEPSEVDNSTDSIKGK